MPAKIPTEIWKVIQEFPNYAVSNHGGVKRLVSPFRTPGGIIKRRLNLSGYWEVTLKHGDKRRRRQIGRLVALAFLQPDPERDETNHKNGIRHDDRLENLEWVTHRENMIHAYHVLDGQALRGEACPHHKLTEQDVAEIRNLLSKGIPQMAIGKLFGVSGTAVWYIKHGRNWAHLKSL